MISKMAMPELLAIFDHAPVGIVFVRDGLLQHCNRRFCELSGYAEDEVFGQRARVLYESEAEYERLRRWAREALLAGDPFDAEIPMRRRDGSLVYCRLHAAAIDRDNPREGTVWIVEDLEEQTRIREELWSTQRDLEATFAAANVGIVLIRGRQIVCANPRLGEMFGVEVTAPAELKSVAKLRNAFPVDVQAMYAEKPTGELTLRMVEPHEIEKAFYAQSVAHRHNN